MKLTLSISLAILLQPQLAPGISGHADAEKWECTSAVTHAGVFNAFNAVSVLMMQEGTGPSAKLGRRQNSALASA